MNGVRRRMGEYFFVKKRSVTSDGESLLAKFRPEDAADAFDASWLALQRCLATNPSQPKVVITHHAPSRQGINPAFAGNGLDGAYASDLDATIALLDNVPIWVHGHTHIRKAYHRRHAHTDQLPRFRRQGRKRSDVLPATHFDI